MSQYIFLFLVIALLEPTKGVSSSQTFDDISSNNQIRHLQTQTDNIVNRADDITSTIFEILNYFGIGGVVEGLNCTCTLDSPELDDFTIRDAVDEWFDDRKAAEEKYGEIECWNTGAVTTTLTLFENRTFFNQRLGCWNVGGVVDMTGMFSGARFFNTDIGSWDVSKVRSMFGVFNGAYKFNRNITSWDTGKVQDMSFMFNGADSFNQDISGWNVEKVENAEAMFQNATAFNVDVSTWGSSIGNLGYMFYGTESFAQELCWDVGGYETDNMFYSSLGCIDASCCAECDESVLCVA